MGLDRKSPQFVFNNIIWPLVLLIHLSSIIFITIWNYLVMVSFLKFRFNLSKEIVQTPLFPENDPTS